MYAWAKSLCNRLLVFMLSLVTDGGPSVTRYVYLHTVEIVSIGWFCLVVSIIWVYIHTHTSDAGMLALVGGMIVPMLTATALNQNTKLTLDNSPKGDPSKVSTPGATVTKGATDDEDK